MTPVLALVHAFWLARRNFRGLRGAGLALYQDRRAHEIIKFTRRHSPFYRAHWAGLPASDWRGFPTLDKAVMMENFSTLNTRGVGREEAMSAAISAEAGRDFRPRVRGLTVGLSSGTSGNRGLFLLDEEEQARWVGTVIARVAPRIRLQGLKVTLFSMSGSNLYHRVRQSWLRFEHFDLGTPVADAVRHLNSRKPDILIAPPSYLDALSERFSAGELKIRPERLISVAEVLEPHVESRLRRIFGCDVHQIYQCTEGLLAVSCRMGRLHLQEDLVDVQAEPLEGSADAARFSPIVTDLWRRVQPVIRYRLNDVLEMAPPGNCACGSGFRVIERVEGRLDDVCSFTTHDGRVRPVFPATLRRMVLLSTPAVRDYELIQERPSQLRVRLAIEPGCSFGVAAAAVRAEMARGLREQGVVAPVLEIEEGEPERFVIRKLRRVRRMQSETQT